MNDNLGSTTLKKRRRAPDPMMTYDALPQHFEVGSQEPRFHGLQNRAGAFGIGHESMVLASVMLSRFSLKWSGKPFPEKSIAF
jgi:hypothetical protein